MNIKRFFLASVVALLVAPVLNAHHSVPVNFDTESNIEVTGTITKTKWANPHSQITIEVQPGGIKDLNAEDPEAATGPEEVEVWLVEMNALNTIRRMSKRMGLNHKTDFVIGEELVVTGWRGRNSNAVYFRKAMLQDGREIVWETRLDPDLQKNK